MELCNLPYQKNLKSTNWTSCFQSYNNNNDIWIPFEVGSDYYKTKSEKKKTKKILSTNQAKHEKKARAEKKRIKSFNLPSKFSSPWIVSDMASWISFSKSWLTWSWDVLIRSRKGWLANRGDSSKLLADPHSIKTWLDEKKNVNH